MLIATVLGAKNHAPISTDSASGFGSKASPSRSACARRPAKRTLQTCEPQSPPRSISPWHASPLLRVCRLSLCRLLPRHHWLRCPEPRRPLSACPHPPTGGCYKHTWGCYIGLSASVRRVRTLKVRRSPLRLASSARKSERARRSLALAQGSGRPGGRAARRLAPGNASPQRRAAAGGGNCSLPVALQPPPATRPPAPRPLRGPRRRPGNNGNGRRPRSPTTGCSLAATSARGRRGMPQDRRTRRYFLPTRSRPRQLTAGDPHPPTRHGKDNFGCP